MFYHSGLDFIGGGMSSGTADGEDGAGDDRGIAEGVGRPLEDGLVR